MLHDIQIGQFKLIKHFLCDVGPTWCTLYTMAQVKMLSTFDIA